MGQEFTVTMITKVGQIGIALSIVISSSYLTSLIESFKLTERDSEEEKRGFKLKVTAIAVYVTWILYCLINVLARSLYVDACGVRPALTQSSWVISRAMVYYFFAMRCHICFQGSSFQFPGYYLKTLILLITIFYGFSAGFYIVRSPQMIWIPSVGYCVPQYIFVDNTWHRLGDALIYIQLSTEAILGVLLVGGYAYKLWKIQRVMQTVSDEMNTDDIDFFKIAKKQGKLAWIAYVSSLLLLYIAGLKAKWAFAPWLDGIINLTCVYCTFAYTGNFRLYKYLCNCNGNRWCLNVCCLLCYCCNEPKNSAEAVLLKTMPSISVHATETVDSVITVSKEMEDTVDVTDVAESRHTTTND